MKRPCTRIRNRHQQNVSALNDEPLVIDQNISNPDIVDIKLQETLVPKQKEQVTRMLTDTTIALGDLQVLRPFSPIEERRATLRAISRQKN